MLYKVYLRGLTFESLFLLYESNVSLVDQGTLIRCYSLNNPVTDARYSGQLSESCSTC